MYSLAQLYSPMLCVSLKVSQPSLGVSLSLFLQATLLKLFPEEARKQQNGEKILPVFPGIYSQMDLCALHIYGTTQLCMFLYHKCMHDTETCSDVIVHDSTVACIYDVTPLC